MLHAYTTYNLVRCGIERGCCWALHKNGDVYRAACLCTPLPSHHNLKAERKLIIAVGSNKSNTSNYIWTCRRLGNFATLLTTSSSRSFHSVQPTIRCPFRSRMLHGGGHITYASFDRCLRNPISSRGRAFIFNELMTDDDDEDECRFASSFFHLM